MKTRWRSPLFRALEVKPTVVSLVITSCAFLHNECMSNGEILDIGRILKEMTLIHSLHVNLLQAMKHQGTQRGTDWLHSFQMTPDKSKCLCECILFTLIDLLMCFASRRWIKSGFQNVWLSEIFNILVCPNFLAIWSTTLFRRLISLSKSPRSLRDPPAMPPPMVALLMTCHPVPWACPHNTARWWQYFPLCQSLSLFWEVLQDKNNYKIVQFIPFPNFVPYSVLGVKLED